jgi:hypothetical protein
MNKYNGKIIPFMIQRKPLDSTIGELRAIELPESVLSAEKWLRKWASHLYSKISAFRNCGYIDEISMIKMQVWSGGEGKFKKDLPFILQFANVKSENNVPVG